MFLNSIHRKRSRIKLKCAAVLRRAFRRCALCLTKPREWYHDATSEFLCSACLVKTETALGEEDSFKIAAERAALLHQLEIQEYKAEALARQRWGSFAPPPKEAKAFVKPSAKPFNGMAPIPVAAHAKVVTAVATLERVWQLREESHCWGAGEFSAEISLWDHMGMAMGSDGTVTGVTKGGQCEMEGVTAGCKVIGVRANPPPFEFGGTTTADLGTQWNHSTAIQNMDGTWGVGLEKIMEALQRCTGAEHETATLVLLDNERGRCEVSGCRRSVKSVFRSTAPTMAKRNRRPRVLRTCLHCAAVLREDYVPSNGSSLALSMQASSADEMRDTPVKTPTQTDMSSVTQMLSRTGQRALDEVSQEGAALDLNETQTNATIRALPEMNATLLEDTVIENDSVTFQDIFSVDRTVELGSRGSTRGAYADTHASAQVRAVNVDLSATGSALGYFQSHRMWVSVNEYELELQCADRLCGFIWFSVRRHRWTKAANLMRITRNRVATALCAIWRGRVVRVTLATVFLLDSLVVNQVVPRLLANKQFLAPLHMTACFASPLMHRKESQVPTQRFRKAADTPHLPSTSVAAFLFAHQAVGAQFLAPLAAGGSALKLPLRDESSEMIAVWTKDAAGQLLARATMRSYRCKQGYKSMILMKRQHAWAWLKYTARSQWAAQYIQTLWRGQRARDRVAILRTRRMAAYAVAIGACDVQKLMKRHKGQSSWFARSSGLLGSVDLFPSTLLSLASFSPKSIEGPSTQELIKGVCQEHAVTINMHSPAPLVSFTTSSFPLLPSAYSSPPPPLGAKPIYPQTYSSPSLFFKVFISRPMPSLPQDVDHQPSARLVATVIARNDRLRRRLRGWDSVGGLAKDESRRLVPLVADSFRQWFLQVRGTMRGKGSDGSLEEFTLEAAAACVDAIRRLNVASPHDKEQRTGKRVPKLLKQCAFDVHEIMVAHRKDRMQLPVLPIVAAEMTAQETAHTLNTVDEATVEMVFRAREAMMATKNKQLKSVGIVSPDMYLRVEILTCDTRAYKSRPSSSKAWTGMFSKNKKESSVGEDLVDMEMVWCGKEKKTHSFRKNTSREKEWKGERVMFSPRGDNKELSRNVGCFAIPHIPPDSGVWLQLRLNRHALSEVSASDSSEVWRLTDRDVWRCLMEGKAVSFDANTGGSDRGRVNLLITVEPSDRTESRTFCESIVSSLMDRVQTCLPDRVNAWALKIDPFDPISQSANKGKAKASIFTDAFSTLIKLEVVDLVHEEKGDERPSLTMRDLFCVVKHRGMVEGVVDSHRPWKAGLAQLPTVAVYGMGSTLLPKPDRPLSFEGAVDKDGDSTELILSLPCPAFRGENASEELEGEDSDEEEVYGDIDDFGTANPDLCSVALGLKQGYAVGDEDSVATGKKRRRRGRAGDKKPKTSIDEGWRQLVVEVYSRRPEGALFRGAIPLPYGALSTLCSNGYARFPLKRRPIDSARGVRVRLIFTDANTFDNKIRVDDTDSNVLQMRTTLPSRTSRSVMCKDARPLPSATSWDGLISVATGGVSRSAQVLDAAWDCADRGTSEYKDWVESELDDDRLSQEDVCDWEDAAFVDMPIRTFLNRLGLSKFIPALEASEFQLVSARSLEILTDHEIQEAVNEYVARNTKPVEVKVKAPVKEVVEDSGSVFSKDDDDDDMSLGAMESVVDDQPLPLVIGRRELTTIRDAIKLMRPRIHKGDNPLASMQASIDNMSERDDIGSVASTVIETSSQTTPATKSKSRTSKVVENTKSSVDMAEVLPDLDSRTLVTRLWADLELPRQVGFTVNLSCIRNPSDIAEPSPIAAQNFCRDKRRTTKSEEMGTVPSMSLSMLMEVFHAQSRHPLECSDGDEPPRFWVPVMEAAGQVKPGTAGSNAKATGTSSTSTPREMERTASESRMVLGMWVKFTKRTRPSHCPPKGQKIEPTIEEVEVEDIPLTPGKSPSINRFASAVARGPRSKKPLRKTVRKGIVVMDNVASLEEQEEIEPLDLDTEVSKLLLCYFLIVCVHMCDIGELDGDKTSVARSHGASESRTVRPPSESTLLDPSSSLNINTLFTSIFPPLLTCLHLSSCGVSFE